MGLVSLGRRRCVEATTYGAWSRGGMCSCGAADRRRIGERYARASRYVDAEEYVEKPSISIYFILEKRFLLWSLLLLFLLCCALFSSS